MLGEHIFLFLGLIVLSYGLGCFSTARVLAKSVRSLNIYKIGTGHSDTENIFNHVSKPLGVLVGIIDFSKMYVYLFLLRLILVTTYSAFSMEDFHNNAWFLSVGFAMVVGHCLPVTHRFKGGRGIFTYMGLVTFFAPYPMLIISLLALVFVFFFKQIRFAQYMIVLLPPLINFLFPGGRDFLGNMIIIAILMGIINFFVSKNLGEI
jgi:glycerol-3-phosphate acyltransferase PlsY